MWHAPFTLSVSCLIIYNVRFIHVVPKKNDSFSFSYRILFRGYVRMYPVNCYKGHLDYLRPWVVQPGKCLYMSFNEYAYVFLSGGHLNVGLLTHRAGKQPLSDILKELCKVVVWTSTSTCHIQLTLASRDWHYVMLFTVIITYGICSDIILASVSISLIPNEVDVFWGIFIFEVHSLDLFFKIYFLVVTDL